MNDYLRDYDARLRDKARQLAALRSTDDIRAWFVNQGRPLDEGENAYAAAFGALQAVTGELVGAMAR